MLRRAAFATLALFALPACHDDDDDDDPQFLTATLGGASSTRADFVIAADGSNVAVDMTPGSTLESAEIRSGTVSGGGATLFTMSSVPVVLVPSDLRPQGEIDTFAEAVDLLRQGGAFVVLRSPSFAGGQASGQIGPAAFRADLSGGSAQAGSALFVLDPAQTQINFSMDATGFTSTPASLQAGAGGPTLFTMGTSSGTLTSADFVPQPSAGITTFDDALQALMNGRTTLTMGTASTSSGAASGTLRPSPPVTTPDAITTPLPSGIAPDPAVAPPAQEPLPTVPSGFAPAPVFTPSFTPDPVFPGVTPPSSTPSPGMPQPSSTPTTPPAESPFVPRPAPLPPSTFSPATTTTTP